MSPELKRDTSVDAVPFIGEDESGDGIVDRVPVKLYGPNGNLISTTHPLAVRQPGSNTFGHGEQDVTTAGTAEQLATQDCREITILAKDGNSGKIFVGDSTVSASSFGAFLRSGDSVTIAVENTDMIYIDAENNNEGVRYYYV